MFSVKKSALIAALACAGTAMMVASPAQAGVVIKSSGPSASQFPVGKKLDDNGRITLKDGDSVTILTNGSTRVIKGPGTHRVAARGTSRRSAFAALTRQRSNARVRTGATRGPGLARPNMWMVDVSQSGTMCVSDPAAVRLWRPGYEQGATYVLAGAGANAAQHVHVSFAAESMVADWNTESMPISDGASYVITGPNGGEPAMVTFADIGELPTTPESLAEALLAKGCTAQAELLADTMM